MSRTTSAQLTTSQAIEKAQAMIGAGRRLTDAAQVLSESRGEPDTTHAQALKESRLLGYRVQTIPDNLTPVLEALILAAAGASPTPGWS